MPKARRLGNYLKATDFDNTIIVRIETPGTLRDTDLREDKALELSVTPHIPPQWKTGGRDPKDWTLNRTSESTLLEALGENTNNWTGKLTRVNSVKQNVMGNMKDVLYSEALTPEEQPKTQEKITTGSTTPGATNITEETTRWLRYHELLIGEVIDEGSWNNMPKPIKQELAGLNLIVYVDGYPTLSPDTAQVLT